jgi:hypothetical protein
MRALLLALPLLAACSSSRPQDLPPPQLPQRAGVDPIVAARAEGVAFRAVGHGPDFVLHIYREDRITLAWDHGAHQETFPKPDPILPRWHGEIYETQNERHRLRVEIARARVCTDAEANGEIWPTTVRVIIDDETREGCGRDL